MNRTQKTLAAFALAAAALANATARAADESAFYQCSREITDGNAVTCPAQEAVGAEANLARRADREAARVDEAVIAKAAKAKRAAMRIASMPSRPINGAVLADGVTIDGA